MLIFEKSHKENRSYHIFVGDPADTELIVDKATYDYIRQLKADYFSIKKELDAIKPIIEHPNFKPALSSECSDCKFAVFNPNGGERDIFGNVIRKAVIGCRRNALCEDFAKEEE